MSKDKNQTPSVAELMLDSQRTKPAFITNPNMDQVVDVVLRLAMEISVLRDRMDIYEKLSEENGFGGTEKIEAFTADESLQTKQSERREKLVQRILHDLSS